MGNAHGGQMIRVKSEFTGKMWKPAARRQVMEREELRAMTTVVKLGETRVKLGTPVGVTGFARASIRGMVKSGRLGEIVSLGAAKDYIDVVEFGRSPTKNPIGTDLQSSPSWPPIRLWVKRIIRPSADMLESVARMVFFKIHRVGFKGKKMFTKAEPHVKRDAKREFDKARRRIERELGK